MRVMKLLAILFISFSVFIPERTTFGEYGEFPISFQVEMLPWNEVEKIIKRKTTFQVIDVG